MCLFQPKIRFNALIDYLRRRREFHRAKKLQKQARRKYFQEKKKTMKIIAQLKKQNLSLEKEIAPSSTKTEKITIINDSRTPLRCIVSGLLINFEKEEIVACPICKNIAKKAMMTEWLKVKGTCPICRERIIIENCSKVDYVI